ncbi:GNAT family N-acetyltransferase [Amantichitinum ursilacus]|uniref:Putative ribosomal N-acetyltransferase YdaF n=1 Tax=Amantichitinum ursilacus TaxID=857265 RepID=A0A0N0XLQ6_9NEIS|nr:GNAT family N-acetyltransferase [Amantichitinum ursilacus]KPC53957.1 putative ribosomal N-acetyltransferase YdaF [Amantichitinum ursilacus]
MPDIPVLLTPRLLLSGFTVADADRIAEFAGDFGVAEMLVNTPHPYPDGMAQAWVDTHEEHWNRGNALYLAVRDRADGRMLGCVELHDMQPGHRAELGYWMAQPYWGRGYATEAARALVIFAFQHLGLYRLDATAFARNAPSICILERLGFQSEGLRPGYTRSIAGLEDVLLYGLLREDFLRMLALAAPDTAQGG